MLVDAGWGAHRCRVLPLCQAVFDTITVTLGAQLVSCPVATLGATVHVVRWCIIHDNRMVRDELAHNPDTPQRSRDQL
jgi:hypothetical protein